MSTTRLTSSQINQNVSATIRFYRLKHGLSLSNLARMVNISQQQMSRYELGVSQLNVVYLYKLAQIFDIDICTFYTSQVSLADADCALNTEYLLLESIRALSIEKQKCLLKLIL